MQSPSAQYSRLRSAVVCIARQCKGGAKKFITGSVSTRIWALSPGWAWCRATGAHHLDGLGLLLKRLAFVIEGGVEECCGRVGGPLLRPGGQAFAVHDMATFEDVKDSSGLDSSATNVTRHFRLSLGCRNVCLYEVVPPHSRGAARLLPQLVARATKASALCSGSNGTAWHTFQW